MNKIATNIQITDFDKKVYNKPAKVLVILFFINLIIFSIFDITDLYPPEGIWLILAITYTTFCIGLILFQYSYTKNSTDGFIKLNSDSISFHQETCSTIENESIKNIELSISGYYYGSLGSLFYRSSHMNNIKIELTDGTVKSHNFVIKGKAEIEYLSSMLKPIGEKVNIKYQYIYSAGLSKENKHLLNKINNYIC